jgi:photosystem II stability/assembly factor-like uncharacterized protein
MLKVAGFIVTLFVGCSTFSQTIQYPTISTHALKGNIVRSFTISSSDQNEMLVGLKGDEPGSALIYYSSDKGENWKVLNNGEAVCTECENIQAVCMVDPKTYLVGTWKNGLFISKDGGKSFKAVKDFPAKDVRSIRASESGRVFAATTSHGILVSDDKGKKWNAIHDASLNKTLSSWTLRIHPGSKNIVYAMTFQDGIYKSLDAGVTWKPIVSEKGLMFWDLGFTQNELYAVASNDSASYIYQSFMGDKKWKSYKLNIPSAANSINIVNTFRDFYFLFGTWSEGLYKSYAIENSIDGFRCTELEKEDTNGVAHCYSSDKYIYNFSWGDGVKILEREEECQVIIQPSISASSVNDNGWGLQASCEMDYFLFKLYDKWGKLLFEQTASIAEVNNTLKEKVKELKPESHIYRMKFSFKEDKDTLDFKGFIDIKA